MSNTIQNYQIGRKKPDSDTIKEIALSIIFISIIIFSFIVLVGS